MGDELLTHRGYTIEIDQDPDGWSYAVSYGTVSLGRFLAHTQEYARSEARQLVDAHISKLASQGNGKAATERLGEMQSTLRSAITRHPPRDGWRLRFRCLPRNSKLRVRRLTRHWIPTGPA